MKITSVIAQPISGQEIREITNQIRDLVGLTNDFYFPIVPFIEQVMPQIFSGFCYDIVDISEMKGLYAEALPQLNLMRIREDVYNNALNDIGRDRFTLAHEVGHFILHGEGRVALARVNERIIIPAYKKPEWQANAFAGELLIPHHLVAGISANTIADYCKVSIQAAEIQVSKK